MVKHSYKSCWIAKVEAEREYFAEDTDHFKDWDRRGAPDVEAGIQLRNAQYVLYGEGGKKLADKYLRAAIEVVDRAIAENKFQASKLDRAGFPRNRAEALRIRAYARGLRGESFDCKDLTTAARDFVEFIEDCTGADWDSQAQAYHFNGVRTALISGDVALARELLQTKRSFKWHAEEHGLLKELTDEAQFGAPIRNEKLRQRVDVFFDRVRDPDFKPDVYLDRVLVRLEWGAIINRYFEPGEQIDWQRVIELVGH